MTSRELLLADILRICQKWSSSVRNYSCACLTCSYWIWSQLLNSRTECICFLHQHCECMGVFDKDRKNIILWLISLCPLYSHYTKKLMQKHRKFQRVYANFSSHCIQFGKIRSLTRSTFSEWYKSWGTCGKTIIRENK